MVAWNSARTKVQLRLAVQRLRTYQEKKSALAKKARRDIATLLEKGKVETAKLRVESMINEDIHIELMEHLELYCELLVARFGILEINTAEPDAQVAEAVKAIIYAAPRTEVKELHVLREMLMHKYGRDFSIAVMENKDSCVSERIVKRINTATPEEILVDAYLEEIAKAYHVKWTNPSKKDDDSTKDGGSGGLKEGIPEAMLEPPIPADLPPKAVEVVRRNENPILPSLPPLEDEKGPSTRSSARSTPAPASEPEDDFEALARRFAALRKR